jgi:hypothetical protein
MVLEIVSRGRRSLLVAWCLLAAALWACAGSGGWRSLDSLAELQDTFNRDAGKYRVILLLSPT